MERYETYIGIDPDVERSGVGVVTRVNGVVEALGLTLPELLNYFMRKGATAENSLVVVEAGWLNKGNWHIGRGDSIALSASKGYHVGRNHQIGMDIIGMATFLGYKVQEIRPLRKCWKGKDRKITAEELKSFTGYQKRTSQEMRDALLIAWECAGLPIIMKR